MFKNQFYLGGVYFDSESWNPPDIDIEEIIEHEELVSKTPKYNVVLLDDNDHTYEYVIEMLMEIFGYSRAQAFEMAFTVDVEGRVVVYTTTKKIAEQKRNQILSYGPDWRLSRSKRSMSAIVEPAD